MWMMRAFVNFAASPQEALTQADFDDMVRFTGACDPRPSCRSGLTHVQNGCGSHGADVVDCQGF